MLRDKLLEESYMHHKKLIIVCIASTCKLSCVITLVKVAVPTSSANTRNHAWTSQRRHNTNQLCAIALPCSCRKLAALTVIEARCLHDWLMHG